MEYIHCYENENDFAGVYDTSSYTEPWASYIESGKTTNYNKNCLTFRIFGDGDIHFTPESGSSIEYKINNGTWDEMPATVSVSRKDIVKFRGWNDGQIGTFSGTTARFSVLGNIMSLVDFDNFRNLTTLPGEGIFKELFAGCTGLFSAKRLELPATELVKDCYKGLFKNCNNLVSPPALPATELSETCYSEMFYGCTKIMTPPELPATTLAKNCYFRMFRETGLRTAPVLPATIMADYCYDQMFYGCKSLKYPPELPSTELATGCCSSMFQESGLVIAPELPATELKHGCYGYMFEKCENLIQAPDLLAPILVKNCYINMFDSCTSLKKIKCMATDISAPDCTRGWVNKIVGSGDFYYASGTPWTRGIAGIPSTWTPHAI